MKRMRAYAAETETSLAVPASLTLAAVVLLLVRAKPYDPTAAVEAVYHALEHSRVVAGDEFETTKWVCIPVSMDVTDQFVDVGALLDNIGRWGCTVVAAALTEHPNRRSELFAGVCV